ncbi:PiggyBac transposable element-derived protein 3 [Amphibalanus amphitrite]|uniref:PiggyBac transposable element-derived protein 3 n=1 Tax=Amphibalanus amphitrite TaxID=1232801 RepID=A0A6A4XFD4_AMPAM|nr:PiggyBac transposable element-derived protein 3 [Amphibalanus amphitrite]
MFTRELLENILEQSNLYATQHGRRLNMAMEELLGIIGVMMMTGYRTTHNKKHLWSAKDDVSSVWAQELMPRNRFLELLQNLHLADNSNISKDRYYKGADVVLGLLNKCAVPPGHAIFFDNLFTSLELLDVLSDMGLGGCGTVRENRLGGAPFSDKKVLEKKQRGTMEWLSDGDNLVVRWNDNRVVTVATNCEPLEPLVTASRYVKKQGGRIAVQMPRPLHAYNTHMGGVDLFDQCVALYRSTIRSKKWWWPLFQWGVDAARTNTWLLSQRHAKGPQLPFLRELTYVLIKKNTVPRPPASFSGRHQAPEDLRYDGLHHWPAELKTRFHRCKVCNSRTNMSCEKCAVPLHPKCMKVYHTP